MEDLSDYLDTEKYKAEARIYSADGKYEKTFNDPEFLTKINECHHLTALVHETKDLILEVEKMLSPLKPHAASLFIEAKGGSVVTKMSLEDFFGWLELGKRIEVHERFKKVNPLTKEAARSVDNEISELLDNLDNE